MYLYAWNKTSEGGANLIATLGGKRIKHEKSKFKGNKNKVVINWGSSQLPEEVTKSSILNDPKAVSICSNKLTFFDHISKSGRVSVPDWTNDPDTAYRWVSEGFIVCARTVLQGHSAEGLILMTKDDPKSLVKAPLYTKYIPKEDEYRVHVVGKEVIDIQRKALRNGWIDEHGPANYKIRNLANGFVYIRNDINPPQSVLDVAIAAVQEVGLDFGAVDVIWNRKRDASYVLEINTAPGLEGSTVENYAKAIKTYTKRISPLTK